MKKLLLIMLAVIMICVVACKEEDAIGEAPEIESIELTPNPCHPGDTVMMKVHYGEPGSNFYFTEYVLGNIKPLSATKKDATHGILLGSAEPTIKCQAADSAGTYRVSFKGKVSFTGNKTVVGKDKDGNKIISDGLLYGETNTVTAQLKVQ
ncbi:MAG: hypothetical protein J5770_00850 [Bacteroidaceae bacterium]|nr:hypothetical protein [Bacteroidaceae bacterium]